MNHGLVEGMAPPRELFAHPTTPFVANFLGFDNMFEGKVAWVGDAGKGGASSDGAAWPIGVALGTAITLRCFWRGNEPPLQEEPVILAFRSERVTLGLPAGPDDPGTNRCDGSVAACVYVGTYQDYLIQAGSLRVRAVGPGDSTFGQGERVTVSIRPDDCRVFSRQQFPAWRRSSD
jgi:ABC-type Fe3+/spermidine/putrescine transport system ATPase subunit